MGKKHKQTTATAEYDKEAVLQAIEHYSDGDIDNPQEILVELQE